jgi:hypothetical protein
VQAVRRVRVFVLSGDFANGHMNRVLAGDDSWGKMFSQALIDMMARRGGAMSRACSGMTGYDWAAQSQYVTRTTGRAEAVCSRALVLEGYRHRQAVCVEWH